MTTIQQQLDEGTTVLRAAGVNSARLDCLLLLEDAIGTNRGWLLAHPDHPISQDTEKKLHGWIARRALREPLAYIRGKVEFYNGEFAVSNAVLIPRPESEHIIDIIKHFASSTPLHTVVDIGTGSGCLAISIKKSLPEIHVTGVDVSMDALKQARSNARAHNVQISWERRDFRIEGLPRIAKTQPFALVANLPYVPEGLITSAEITHEPSIALFSGRDGLEHFRDFFEQVGKLQHKPIAIVTESLESQHNTLKQLAATRGYKLNHTQDLIQLFLSA